MDKQADLNEYISSPCIRRCTLNDDDICVGCFRSRLEILDWMRMNSDEQKATLKRCADRRKQSKSFRFL